MNGSILVLLLIAGGGDLDRSASDLLDPQKVTVQAAEEGLLREPTKAQKPVEELLLLLPDRAPERPRIEGFLKRLKSSSELENALPKEAVEALPGIGGRLTDPSEKVRASAIDDLSDRTEEGVPKFLERFLKDESGKVRAGTLHALVSMEGSERLVTVEACLSDEAVEVRCEAARGIRKLKQKDCEKWLRPMLKDESFLVRFNVVKILAARSDRDGLRTALSDERETVRAIAAEALGTLGDGKGIEKAAADSSVKVRQVVVTVLGRSARKDDAPVLIARLDDEEEAIRLTAARGLARIAGESHGFRTGLTEEEHRAVVTRWQAWWQKEQKSTDNPDG